MSAAVKARGLTVSRAGERVAGPLDLTVEPGEVVRLEGSSGAGKTTLLKAVGGLLGGAPGVEVAGRLVVADLDPFAAPASVLASRVGQLFQVAEEQLVAFDVRGEVALRLENLNVPEAQGAPRVERALKSWGLQELAERETSTLSAGEAKRVALAAALVARPEVVLLDEPFTALDPAWRARLAKDVKRVKGKAAVVLVDHHDEEARAVADRSVAIRVPKGRAFRRGARREGVPEAPFRLRLSRLRLERGGRVLLRDESLDLGPGFVALVGPNGAGKTTLLRAIVGLDAPAAGDVRVDGLERPHRASPLDVARHVGFAGHLSLDHFTAAAVGEELALTPDALARAAPRGTLGRAPAAFLPRVAAEPFGLDERLERHPLALSGGERQRLAFAVAVAHAPNVVLLDEPTVGLDAAGRFALLQLVRETRARLGLVLAATHDEDLIAEADRVVVVHEGRLRDAGAPDDFFQKAGRRLGYRRPAAVEA